MDDSQHQPGLNDVPNPVGVPNKEAEKPVSDFVVPSEVEPQISEEVKEAGVEIRAEFPTLSDEHISAGINPALENTPVKTEPSDNISLPMTKEEAKSNAKGNISDSKTWLSRLVFRLFQRMRLVPKRV
jgi:hypothetical protein